MVNIEQHAKVSVITLNDEKVNVLNGDSLSALKDALGKCRESRAVVLTGQGKCFSAGLDLKRLPTLDKEQLFGVLELLSDVSTTILRFPCPVIAAVNGHAIAGGAVLTLCCDVAIGPKQDLKIGLSEVAVGMPLPKFVVELARHRLSPTKLTEAVLFGKLYSWEEALEAGYLHKAVDAQELIPTCLAVAEQLASLPRVAYETTKLALWSALPDRLEAEAIGAFLTEQAQSHMAKFKA